MLSAKMNMGASGNHNRRYQEGIQLAFSGVSSVGTETFLWRKLHLEYKYRSGGLTQVVEQLLSKCEALSSSPRTAKKISLFGRGNVLTH
jgi:hypothetical protein